MCLDLRSNGIDLDKTNSTMFPILEDDALFMHFMRGFLDGDGCIYKLDNKLSSIHFTNSNIEFFNYLQQKLSNLNIKSSIYKEKDKKFRLNISLKDAKIFLNMLYNDSDNLRLKRKFDIFNTL